MIICAFMLYSMVRVFSDLLNVTNQWCSIFSVALYINNVCATRSSFKVDQKYAKFLATDSICFRSMRSSTGVDRSLSSTRVSTIFPCELSRKLQQVQCWAGDLAVQRVRDVELSVPLVDFLSRLITLQSEIVYWIKVGILESVNSTTWSLGTKFLRLYSSPWSSVHWWEALTTELQGDWWQT